MKGKEEGSVAGGGGSGGGELESVNRDCCQTTVEHLGGMMGLSVKNYLFNGGDEGEGKEKERG